MSPARQRATVEALERPGARLRANCRLHHLSGRSRRSSCSARWRHVQPKTRVRAIAYPCSAWVELLGLVPPAQRPQNSTRYVQIVVAFTFGFEGKHGIGTDTDAGGVVLMGARLYSPMTGRFLQVDAVFGGACNAYDYTCQDPVNATDLSGTCVPLLHWHGGPLDIFGGRCPTAKQKIEQGLTQSLTSAERNPEANTKIISSITDALECLTDVGGDDLAGIGGCIVAGGSSSIADEIDNESIMGVAFALDPLGAIIGELVSVFSCIPATTNFVGTAMTSPHFVIINVNGACDSGKIILPT